MCSAIELPSGGWLIGAYQYKVTFRMVYGAPSDEQ